MTATTTRRAIDATLSEGEWQQQIIDYAELRGWMVFHDTDSRKNRRGFPDLVLIRPPDVIFLECKTEAKRSKPSPEQAEWIRKLKLCRRIQADIARPRHWPDIEKALR